MKRFRLFSVILFIVFLKISPVFPQEFNLKNRSFSILGPDRDAIYSIFSPTATTTTVTSSTQAAITSNHVSAEVSKEIPMNYAPKKAGAELLGYLAEKDLFKFTKEKWIKMRRVEQGEEAPSGQAVSVSSAAKPSGVTTPPLPPGISVELPYESQLSISGRKLIGIDFKSTFYDKPLENERVNTNSFNMTQELQVRINGRVGKKIKVNVDFDDTTQDKRDISVAYNGDPDEFIQEAAFGDITMSLPSTEFVGYSRQLFGVKVHGRSKRTEEWGFFSQTKGDSEVKRFTGNTTLTRTTIADTSYIPLKYYNLYISTPGYTPAAAFLIKPGSAKVWRDDRNPFNDANTSTMTVELPGLLANTTGHFDLLVAGNDYTIDYNRGVIIFRNTLARNHIIAVDYQFLVPGGLPGTWVDGPSLSSLGQTPGNLKVIKGDETVAPIYTQELKTYYNLGNLKIVRDNGRGNFILKVLDLNNVEAPSLGYLYPQKINVDFEAGVFNFVTPDNTTNPFPADVYSLGQHHFNILAEYSYRIKFITLRPGIVPQSERVLMDGRLLKANDSYFIDYDAGILTFLRDEDINESTVIEVSYDFSPFGSAGNSTLVGLRSQLSLTNSISVGSSYIYNFAAKPQSIPDIRTTPTSLMVWEADSTMKSVKLPFLPLKLSLSGEYAMSQQNPNTFDKAIIESMEDIKQEDMASLNYQSWQYGSNPGNTPYWHIDPANSAASAITVTNENIKKTDINPTGIVATNDETQQVLDLNYQFQGVHSAVDYNQVSIIQPLSKIGIDFSQKAYLEMWVYGDNSQADLSVSYGTFNENADEDTDGILDTEDINYDGTLNAGEDIGWLFQNQDQALPAVRIGANNGRIDTADLDGNGIYNTTDFPATGGPYGPTAARPLADSAGTIHPGIDWTGWKFFRVPLNITNPDDWKSIKQVRVTLKQGTVPGALAAGLVKFAAISLTSDRWKITPVSVAGSTVAIAAVNNELTPGYVSLVSNPEYQGLYDITSSDDLSQRKEQALQFDYGYTGSTSTELSAVLPFTKSYDLSNYKTLKVWVYRKATDPGDVFFMQAGDDVNYFEYSVPLDQFPANIPSASAWQLITIDQTDVTGDSKPDLWAPHSANGAFSGATTLIKGAPSLQNISQFKVGVRAVGDTAAIIPNREIWVNDIFVTDAWKKDGHAWRVNADFELPGWMTFGGKRKSIDSNFQTFSAGVYNRDYLEDNAYVNISKLSFLPITSNMTRAVTVTPGVLQNQGNLVSLLQEGRVISYSGTGTANLSISKYPRLGGSYTRAITDTQEIQRLEDRETVLGSLDYVNPINFVPVLPTAISGSYGITNSLFKQWRQVALDKTDSQDFMGFEALKDYLDVKNYLTDEITETWNTKTPFTFWKNFNFTPTYGLTTVNQKDRTFPQELDYNKSSNQDVRADASITVFPWLQPKFSYAINSKENYNILYTTAASLSSSTTTVTAVAGPPVTKYIERNSSAQASWNLQMKDLIDQKFLNSLGFSYSFGMQDSDSYDNVDSSVAVLGLDKLWIRNSPILPLQTGTSTYYLVKSINRKDDVRLSGRYNPFETLPLAGRLTPVKTLSTNFTYSGTDEYSYITGTTRNVYTRVWPDLVFGMTQLEKLFALEKSVGNTQLNVRTQSKQVLTASVDSNQSNTFDSDLRFNLLRKYDISMNVSNASNSDFDLINNLTAAQGSSFAWGTQSGINFGVWRVTVRYDDSQTWQKDASDRLTQQLFSKTFTGTVYSNVSFPQGVRIPFTSHSLPLTNKLVFNSTVKYARLASSLNVERDNTDTYTLNADADYEVSKNFRLAFGLGYSRLLNRTNSDFNYSSISASSRLTIQF
jgi:hypothetical protein